MNLQYSRKIEEKMPPKNMGTVWKAEPHTLAKIEILSNYLSAYFQILGRSRRGQTLLYIDGFAGPGEYTNSSKGSPIAALLAARQAISSAGTAWIAGDIHCVFIEDRLDRYKNLTEHLQPFQGSPRIHIHTYNSSFVDGLMKIRNELATPFQSDHPLFVFIDPFGATGAPFTAVTDILSSPCSEVLINLDADGISRIFLAQEAANSDELLNTIFGDNSWQDVLKRHAPSGQLCRDTLELYMAKLRSLPNVRYLFPFEMLSRSASLNYFLVFASKHPLGLVKMKEAMKRIDQDGSYRFSDASRGQTTLFRFDEPDQYSGELYARFQGRTVSYDELLDFTLNETPLINPSKMLANLEKKELITKVEYHSPNRRRGAFAPDKTVSVTFEPNTTLDLG
jgi:three-Cys-motif partner protein